MLSQTSEVLFCTATVVSTRGYMGGMTVGSGVVVGGSVVVVGSGVVVVLRKGSMVVGGSVVVVMGSVVVVMASVVLRISSVVLVIGSGVVQGAVVECHMVAHTLIAPSHANPNVQLNAQPTVQLKKPHGAEHGAQWASENGVHGVKYVPGLQVRYVEHWVQVLLVASRK